MAACLSMYLAHTHSVCQEETQKLLLQIEALEQQKAFLSCNSKEKLMAMLLADQEGETHGLSMRDEDVRSVEEQNKAAREVIRLQQLSLWGTQSALSDWLVRESKRVSLHAA